VRTLKSGLLIAGFGGEGAGSCVVRPTLKSAIGRQIYAEVIWEDESKLKPYNFIDIELPWLFDPGKALNQFH
jgi:hypothetical protein